MNDSLTLSGSHVMITGGSGLVGRYLTSALLSEGCRVSHLSRQENQFGKVRVFRWNPELGILDEESLAGVDYIVHLAGANIGEKRWSENRKREIISSRVNTANLLFKTVSENNIRLKAFISASAIGYYGLTSSEHIYTESDPPGSDFLAETCVLWEKSAGQFATIGTRTVMIRTAVVLEKSDSALSRLLIPARFGIFPVLGGGSQYMPWIHIKDLCGIYLKAIKNENMSGVFNAVAPEHITHRRFMETLAGAMGKRRFHPPVPGFLLRLGMGKMADVILSGSRVSSEKIISEGYSFAFPGIRAALENLLNPENS
ncbi:MAG TPA: TIGR01777 family oxidoreductase [Bacteroidales bacterium]|nr:TIGR01777 family oxidoreductase [Bacteroidales bacterium]